MCVNGNEKYLHLVRPKNLKVPNRTTAILHVAHAVHVTMSCCSKFSYETITRGDILNDLLISLFSPYLLDLPLQKLPPAQLIRTGYIIYILI